ncbi:MAG: TorF family putative porin [Gammaproteobacteria bacterium]
MKLLGVGARRSGSVLREPKCVKTNRRWAGMPFPPGFDDMPAPPFLRFLNEHSVATYNGFYLGVWASNTESSDANIEIDYYGGYRYTWSGITFDVTGLYYHYPGEDEND